MSKSNVAKVIEFIIRGDVERIVFENWPDKEPGSEMFMEDIKEKILSAIDQLPAQPQGKDCVSRKAVLQLRNKIVNLVKNRKGYEWPEYILDLDEKDFEKLLKTLPAETVLDKQLLESRIRDYLKIRRGWISVTVEEFLADIFKEKKP